MKNISILSKYETSYFYQIALDEWMNRMWLMEETRGVIKLWGVIYGFILFTSRHEAQDGTGQTNKQTITIGTL